MISKIPRFARDDGFAVTYPLFLRRRKEQTAQADFFKKISPPALFWVKNFQCPVLILVFATALTYATALLLL